VVASNGARSERLRAHGCPGMWASRDPHSRISHGAEAYERFESDTAAAPPPKHELEQRGERLLPEGRRPPPAAKGTVVPSAAQQRQRHLRV